MKVLITRSEPGASQTAERLKRRGAEPVIAPLLRIRFIEDVVQSLEKTHALLFTSPNAVRAWLADRSETDLPAFCVGDSTAAEAEAAGFSRVRSAGGDVGDLLDLCEARLVPGRHRLLYLRGQHTSGDLAGALQARGFEVDEAIVYEAVAENKLPLSAARVIRRRELAVALFHSRRAAIAFTALTEEADLSDYLNTVIAVAISEKAAEGLVRSDWAAVKVAETPDETDMLNRIGFAP
ncbi:uroporphyrinogen-III synthase [Hyphobacterium sp. HN65]|uniref:Uroporphyrinogen-III synthase n=1 Tax=Hyphobacterium lacteum TaxID=3116575 RepID=A0ABU7LSM3_9PROT|nr:uroporphyrinogen-III synthase [Hyphobacterium sp. HN65]MEE2526584.1 uroporphyrinogen-III synthase [Hyphobacterium sp. HN65]